jgi:transcription antitermination protein NusB
MSSRPTRGPSRRQARRAAMMLLYQRSLTERPLEELIARYEEDAGIELPAYGRRLVEDVEAKQPELDAEIDAHAHGWTSDRISPVERAALRIATLELLDRPDVPAGAAIEEAVRLARRYASPEAASFVNGVLGAIARAHGVGR